MKKKLLIFIVIIMHSLTAYATNPYSENPRVLTPPMWNPDSAFTEFDMNSTETSLPGESEMGRTEVYGNGKIKFSNYVDGYSLILPNTIKADLSLAEVCTTFSDETITFRVFKESFGTEGDVQSYISYSNKFLENTTDHTLELEESYSLNEKQYKILQWSRKKLERIDNDKNYYACVDVIIDTDVYTFFFTSSVPYESKNDYMSFLNSFTTFTATIPPELAYNKGYKKTDISRLNEKAQETYNELFAEDADFKLGLFHPNKVDGYNGLEKIEKQLGYEFSVFLLYSQFLDIEDSSNKDYRNRVNEYVAKVEENMVYARQTGKVIELTLQTPLTRKNSSANMIYEILDGEYDRFIYSYAKMVAEYPDVTVLFRPFNEMNGDWCNYSSYHLSRDTQLYIELYKYIYEKFEESGCDNVIWVWNPNERSFPNFKWNHESLYYPGDEYVDVYGITGYNTGTYYSGETWRSFDEIYTPIYKRALKLNEKPLMITEFASSSIGGNKVKWIEDMFKVLPKYSKIKVAIWWNNADWDGINHSRPYFIDTPNGTLNVFDKYLN